jgi:hypothetical protein
MKLRDVQFPDEAACIADVRRLAAGCRSGGSWSLPQACFHLDYPIRRTLANPPGGEATPEQKKMHSFIDDVIANGWPTGTNSPKEMAPRADIDDTAVDSLIDALQKLRALRTPAVNAFVFGPIDTEKFRRFMLIHAGHHLSFFSPT